MESRKSCLLLSVAVVSMFWMRSSHACFMSLSTDGNYSIGAPDKTLWLNAGPMTFHTDGNWMSTGDGSLKVKESSASSGMDEIGPYQDMTFSLADVTGNLTMDAVIRTYQDGTPAVVFIQRFPKGLKNSTYQVERTLSGFPSFRMEQPSDDLGYLSFGDDMFGDIGKKTGKWGPSADVNDGLAGTGPLAIFDKKGNTLLISPYNNVMAASAWLDKDAAILKWGIMGGVKSLPAGFEYKTIAYCSSSGIGETFSEWGKLMRKVNGKTDDVIAYHQKQDLTLTHLGYWTDNGAYYYYHPESGKNYEQTLLDIRTAAISSQIPYRYMQLDSWFYPKDDERAVTTWDAMESVFPRGIPAFQDELHMPLAAHNRYWSTRTTYAKQNGGLFDFNLDGKYALPAEEVFWEVLLGHGREEWGLILYEQDWLNVQFLNTDVLTTNLTMGRTWLTQMGQAANRRNVKIQYCMSLSRHALQSLEIPVVTQARVSNDYHASVDQWKIGVSSHFADAMGVAPSKDTFWTVQQQPGNPYNKTEPYPTLQVLTAVLSRGPVGPGDRIGATDKDPLMRCCNDDGLILKPSRPAKAIDDQLLESAFADQTGPQGEVWTTYSEVNGGLYGVIVAAGLTADYVITPGKAGFLSPSVPQFTESVIYSYDTESKNVTTQPFTNSFTITASDCTAFDNFFCVYYTAPVLHYGGHEIVLLGDLTKWVPMSDLRVLHVWNTTSALAVAVSGKPREEAVTLTYLLDGQRRDQTAKVNERGCAVFTIVNSQMIYEDNVQNPKFHKNLRQANPRSQTDGPTETTTLTVGSSTTLSSVPTTTGSTNGPTTSAGSQTTTSAKMSTTTSQMSTTSAKMSTTSAKISTTSTKMSTTSAKMSTTTSNSISTTSAVSTSTSSPPSPTSTSGSSGTTFSPTPVTVTSPRPTWLPPSELDCRFEPEPFTTVSPKTDPSTTPNGAMRLTQPFLWVTTLVLVMKMLLSL